MKSVNQNLETTFNRLLASTDINIREAEKIINDSMITTIAMARRFEKSPFQKPTDMSDEDYKLVQVIYLELRVAYFNHTHDIFSWVRYVNSLSFTCTDSRTIMLERLYQLTEMTCETVLDWRSPIMAMFGKSPKWKSRVKALMTDKA